MSESKKLTKRQLAVLEDLFTSNREEKTVLKNHAVPRSLYERWLADKRFTDQLQQRIAGAYRQSHIILARKASHTARRLIKLTGSDKEETARKACLDIISILSAPTSKAPSGTPPASEPSAPATDLSPETASRLLATLAGQA